MKNTSITALAVCLVSGGACGASDFVDTAQVLSSRPVIERVTETRQECGPAPAPQNHSNSVAAPIVGGVIGGLLGHQVGQGRGKTAATIVGAAGGAVAGSAIANSSNSQPAQQQCRTIESSRDVVSSYDVVYRYNGRDVNVRLPFNPGNSIKVGISAIPDDRAGDSGRSSNNNAPPPPR